MSTTMNAADELDSKATKSTDVIDVAISSDDDMLDAIIKLRVDVSSSFQENDTATSVVVPGITIASGVASPPPATSNTIFHDNWSRAQPGRLRGGGSVDDPTNASMYHDNWRVQPSAPRRQRSGQPIKIQRGGVPGFGGGVQLGQMGVMSSRPPPPSSGGHSFLRSNSGGSAASLTQSSTAIRSSSLQPHFIGGRRWPASAAARSSSTSALEEAAEKIGSKYAPPKDDPWGRDELEVDGQRPPPVPPPFYTLEDEMKDEGEEVRVNEVEEGEGGVERQNPTPVPSSSYSSEDERTVEAEEIERPLTPHLTQEGEGGGVGGREGSTGVREDLFSPKNDDEGAENKEDDRELDEGVSAPLLFLPFPAPKSPKEDARADDEQMRLDIIALVEKLELPKSADVLLATYEGRENELLKNLTKMEVQQWTSICDNDHDERGISNVDTVVLPFPLGDDVDDCADEGHDEDQNEDVIDYSRELDGANNQSRSPPPLSPETHSPTDMEEGEEDCDDVAADDDDGGWGSLQRAAALSVDDSSAFGTYPTMEMERDEEGGEMGSLECTAALSGDDEDDDVEDQIFGEVYDRISRDRHPQEAVRPQPAKTAIHVSIPSLMDLNSASSSFSLATMTMTTPVALQYYPVDQDELEEEEGRRRPAEEDEEPRDDSPPSPHDVKSMVDHSLTGGPSSSNVDNIDSCPPLSHHQSDFVADLEKIDEGGGSDGPSEFSPIPSASKEEKEPLKQFYDYRHRFYNEQYHYFDDSRFSSRRQGSGNFDDDKDIESTCSSVTLSEAFDQASKSDWDTMSATSSLTEEYYPRERGRSVDSRASSSYAPSHFSTTSSVTLSRVLGDDLERHEHHDRGFYVATRLGDFIEDVVAPSPAGADAVSANGVINEDGNEEIVIEKNDMDDEEIDALSYGGVASSNGSAKKTVGHQIASSDFEDIGSDMLDLLPECGVPIPSVMAQVGVIRARPSSRGGMLLPWNSARSIQNYGGRSKKKGGGDSSRSMFSISSVHSFRG